MSSEPIELPIPTGVIKNRSPNSASARYTDSDKMRFVGGKAEKIGGWSKLIEDQFESFARGASPFIGGSGSQHICFGTSDRLYIIAAGGTLTNITPLFSSGTLTDPISTTSGSDIIDIADTGHGLTQVGQVVFYTGATAVGGVTIDGEYTVYAIVDSDNYQIQHSSAATSTAGPGGGSVDFEYEIAKGSVDALRGQGWGAGGWGEGTWGTPRDGTGIAIEPRLWSIDTYGSNALACYNGSVLYDFTYGTDSRAQVVSNSPAMRAMFVTPERFPFALGAVPIGGSTIDPMTVRWPDVDDITDWTPTNTNTSNERRLQYGSKLIAGARLSKLVSLVWSDSGLYTFQYTGSDVVYNSELAGEKCGLAGPYAFIVVDDVAYWISQHGFHMYNGSVGSIPRNEEIREFVIDSFNTLQLSKVACGYVSQFREVWWIYPSESDEPDRYVAVNVDTFDWFIGTIGRTAICRYRTDSASPLMFGSDRYVYLHEDGTKNDDGAAMEAYLETGIMKIGAGKQSMHVNGFVPDLERQDGDLNLLVFTRDRPNGGNLETQTKTIEEGDTIVDLRVNGRHVGYRITSDEIDGDFRIGTNALEVDIDGERR